MSLFTWGRSPQKQPSKRTGLAGKRPLRPPPRGMSQATAVGDLGRALHPVVLRLTLSLRGGTGVDLRGQRDRNGGEDQRGDKSLGKHGVSPLGCLGGEVR